MSNYSPGKRGHQILQRLASGEASFAEIVDLFPEDGGRRRLRSKLVHIMAALRDDDLVEQGASGYALSEPGRAALAALDARERFVTDTPRPNVRIFVPVEARG